MYGESMAKLPYIYSMHMAKIWHPYGKVYFSSVQAKVLEIASKHSPIAEVSEGKIKAILGPNGEPIQSYPSPKERIRV